MSELPAPRIIRMTVEYDGSNFNGFQSQQNGRSVQDELERALQRHLGEAVRLTAAGRTDTGVHALGQVVSFRTTNPIPTRGILMGMLPLLPPDVAVRAVDEAAPDFCARRCARLRMYRFVLLNGPQAPVVARQYITHIRKPINLDAMRSALDVFHGRYDFRAFRSAHCQSRRTVLTMNAPIITQWPGGLIVLDIACRSFLHNMVRIVTGCLVAVGQGRMTRDDLLAMRETGERPYHAVTLDPNGLFLYRVLYPDDLAGGTPAEALGLAALDPPTLPMILSGSETK